MQIYWHGLSSVRIEASVSQRDVVLVTDPFESDGTVKFSKGIFPDVVVCSHQDRSRFDLGVFENKPFVISDPGEYEVKGAYIHGIQEKGQEVSEKTSLRPLVYRFVMEGISLAFLGQRSTKLSDYEVEALENIDILLLPVGGGDVMDARVATDAISVIEPRMVIPLHYDVPGLKTSLGSVDQFCAGLGACTRQDASKLKLTKKDLPADQLLVTVLERS